jgi:hypothetical protein
MTGETGMTGDTGASGSTGETGVTGPIPTVLIDYESFAGFHVEVLADTYTLDQSAAYAYDIITLIGKTSTGSCDLTVAINGTPITGMDEVTVNDSEDTLTAGGGNSVSIGDTVTLVIGNLASSPADLAYTVKTLRP